MRTAMPAVLAAVAVLLGPTGPAGAATLQISPVMVDMAPQQGASGITLRNPDAMPVYGQVRVYAWEQRDGDDVLLPTDEIQVSPPIIQVPPRSEQLVRLVRASREPAAIEKSYRLVIDEIPDPSTPAVNGVVLRLRYSVPVFVAGATPEPRPELSWRAAREGKEWVLSLNNTGTRYAQVASLQVLDSGGKPVAEVDGLVGYALAQRQRQWRIPAGRRRRPRAYQGPDQWRHDLGGAPDGLTGRAPAWAEGGAPEVCSLWRYALPVRGRRAWSIALALSCAVARAADLPDQLVSFGDIAERDVFLEVSINGANTSQLLRFRDAQGRLSASADALRSVGIDVPEAEAPLAVRRCGWMRFRACATATTPRRSR